MLQRKFRLRQKSGFKAIFEIGKNYSAKNVAIYVLFKEPNRFGFIASKKVGNAVQRNRAKRLMREVIRLNLPEIRKDIQIICIARARIKGVSYSEVESNIMYILKRANTLIKR
ncbi:ribonuclease P protein component [Desulfosporosinus meridiei]|uniref:Ribonuclease P protein component n=1 Tax=Desulfosporosinus meridiei (strain ATCC BAA-275 / DSM 13257 / KCTC 12902 / NCIMB 13706 / S10) TaxID=768704 RepID=J7IXA7_DESMD|nr:ribonuclease P protein component [Desulfosporosinus meridiei]AFQ46462.1 RNase P protein component [Desulfosporosinus meridiei DSM 13257]